MIFRCCILALVIAPLGPAAQNFFTLFLLLAILLHCSSSKGIAQLRLQIPVLKPYLYSSTLLLAGFLCSDLYWHYVPVGKMLEYTGGYLSIVIFPLAGALFLPRLSEQQRNKLKPILTVVMVSLSLICLSQFLFGWQWRNMQFTTSELRARGFYSHPLTLAYAIALILPFSWHQVFTTKGLNRKQLPLLISTLLIIFVSKSRIVQLATIAYACFKIIKQFRSRERLIGIVSVALLCGIVTLVPNPIRDNFAKTLSGNNDHEATSYPDDRVLFWHAHALLALDSPLIGHSPHAPQTLRDEKYTLLGFADFSKKYSAHNTFLQMVVDAGVMGLILFFVWLASVYQLSRQVIPMKLPLVREIMIIFLLCSLTQNSWQDIEVRFVMSMLLALIFMNQRQLSQ